MNNAGIVRDAAIWNMPVENWDLVMAVHVRGTWSLSHFAAKYFREQNKAGAGINGRIINTTSGAGLGGNFGQTNYATAKAAIAGLTLTLAQELAASNVTVNCIGPAGLTRITATMPGAGEAFEPDDVAEGEFHPMDPKNSSPVVAWLASDEADYVTGQIIRCPLRPDHPDEGLVGEGGHRERQQGVGRHQARFPHGRRGLRRVPHGHQVPEGLTPAPSPVPVVLLVPTGAVGPPTGNEVDGSGLVRSGGGGSKAADRGLADELGVVGHQVAVAGSRRCPRGRCAAW